MNISDIMTSDCVVVVNKAESKRQLLQSLSEAASKISGINDRTIFDALLERENLGSTGFGHGTALPHARIKEVQKVYGLFAKVNHPVDFESVDNQPVDLVFLLLSPENSGADHLTALASTSRILKDENTCKELRKASTAQELYSILSK